MNLNEFLIKLIQADSLSMDQIKDFIRDPQTETELLMTLLKNYEIYEKLIHIKNAMDIG